LLLSFLRLFLSGGHILVLHFFAWKSDTVWNAFIEKSEVARLLWLPNWPGGRCHSLAREPGLVRFYYPSSSSVRSHGLCGKEGRRGQPDGPYAVEFSGALIYIFGFSRGSVVRDSRSPDSPGEVRRLVRRLGRCVDVGAPLEFLEGQALIEAPVLVGILRSIPARQHLP
jgi:hypothetical protein